MQPYFMPYIGYFSLIKHVDKFILLDEVQFIRHGWIERNRILKQTGGWQYISIPLIEHSQKTIIKNIKINNTQQWRDKILAQLGHYNKAPFYWEVKKLLEDIFQYSYQDITHLNKTCLLKICEYLDINTPIEIYSEMELCIEEVRASDEWALNVCKAIGNVKEYWNPPGGKEFFCKTKYDDAKINLKFQKVILEKYKQKDSTFEEGLSIIDVLMFNDKNKINKMLDRYEFLC